MVLLLVERACQRQARSTALEFRQGNTGLATVAATAALLGLLGNTWGMANSFPGCGGSKWACLAAVVSLLGQSFLINAWGLSLAIASYLAHAHFTRRLGECENEMEVATFDLLQALSNRRAFPA